MIRKALLESDDLEAFLLDAEAVGQLGYKGLDIEMFTHPALDEAILFVVQGLGHKFNIIYIFDQALKRKDAVTLQLDSLYNDFTYFVMYERNGGTDGIATKPN